ncbi:hypothetical protein P5V15_003145 [Pogonomyrmex californicus]
MENAKRESKSAHYRAEKSAEHNANHPWNALTTVTAFDTGNNTDSTICLDNLNENQTRIVQQPPRLNPATSVLVESLIQQLCTMLEGDKVCRNKLYYAICDKLCELQLINDTYKTVEFGILRGKYQKALYHLFTLARGEFGDDRTLSLSGPGFAIPELSRYHSEFHELSFIARGGFGDVYKALHRLDGTEYAIKKIIVPADRSEIIKQQLNEVKALAKLTHTNIVSYKAAWIESMLPPLHTSNVSTNFGSYKLHTSKYRRTTKSRKSLSIENLLKDNKNDTSRKERRRNGSSIDDDDSHDVINERFEELNSSVNIIGKRIVEENIIEEYTNESSSDIVSFRNSNNNEILDQTNSDTSNSSSCEDTSNREICTYATNKNRQYLTLYIQMALCEQTLEQWLRHKINVTSEPMIRAIFQQILCGVDYMHSREIVHHDIKPSNIFISTSGQLQIQLGDFGLACPQKETHQSVVGTHIYAAPEQLQGKCDPKSDIYSIGIVLIELSVLIKTQMELSSIINSLKYGNIPETLVKYKWAHMIKLLVQEDPTKRPSMSQLLQDFSEDKDVIITGLKDTIMNLENDNRHKDHTIQELQEEIALLKKKLNASDMLNAS